MVPKRLVAGAALVAELPKLNEVLKLVFRPPAAGWVVALVPNVNGLDVLGCWVCCAGVENENPLLVLFEPNIFVSIFLYLNFNLI